ncbi:MAG: glycosyltransferase family 4 protein [Burkholderiales bacterium]
MKILFVHQNFPGQYRHLAAALARTPGWEVVGLGDPKNIKNRPPIPGVKLGGYQAPAPASPRTHHYVAPLESAVRRGQSVVRACLELKKRGFTPDVIHAHPGWGEALFLKDVFPAARVTVYCEFYYRGSGTDVGFDPEYPATLDDVCRVRVKNAASLLSLEAADAGVSPTQWQKKQFPKEYQDRIEVVPEGVNTDLLKPDAAAELVIPERKLKLTPSDEVITYVARNLEPYRGFHVFMRALPEIQRRRPNAHVLVVGADGVSYGRQLPKDTTYRKRLLEEVGAKLALERVHFLGQVPYSTLVKVYQVSSAHVYLTYPFVLSWSLLEAMAAGCVIVGSRTPPLEEVVTDGRNGFLTDFFDTAKLAERVNKVLEKRKDLQKVRERARKTIVERYDLKRVCLPGQLKLLGVTGKKPGFKSG